MLDALFSTLGLPSKRRSPLRSLQTSPLPRPRRSSFVVLLAAKKSFFRRSSFSNHHLEKVFFSSDGSSATEAALKIAFQYWHQSGIEGEALSHRSRQHRTKFVSLGEAYHGDTLGAIGVGGVDRFTSIFSPLTFEAIRVAGPGMTDSLSSTGDGGPRIDPSSRHTTAEATLSELENLFKNKGSEIAALIMEPLVQAAGGILVHPPGFLRAVRELTERFQILLILQQFQEDFLNLISCIIIFNC